MSKIFKSFPSTVISFIIGATIFIVSLLLDLDIFEKFIEFLESMEHLEFDEIIIPVFILMIGVFIDSYLKYTKKKKLTLIANTKLEFLKTVLRTVQDIVGNSMNNLILYSSELKETGSLSEKSIKELDVLIYSTSKKINELANMKEIHEKELFDNMYVIDTVDDDKKT